MTRDNVLKLFDLLKVKTATTGGAWVLGFCPLAAHRHSSGVDRNPSFQIEVNEKGGSRVHCFSCRGAHTIPELIWSLWTHERHRGTKDYDFNKLISIAVSEEAIEDNSVKIGRYREVSEIETIFPDGYLARFESAKDHPYLQERGIGNDVCEFLDLRYDDERKRLCFPIRGKAGELLGMYGRDVTGQQGLRYYSYGYRERRNPYVWYGEHWIDSNEPLIIVEGQIDLARILPQYTNVVCNCTTGMSEAKVKRLAGFDKIVSFFDFGKGGDKARTLIEKRFGDRVIEHIIPTREQDDAGNMTNDEIKKAIDFLM